MAHRTLFTQGRSNDVRSTQLEQRWGQPRYPDTGAHCCTIVVDSANLYSRKPGARWGSTRSRMYHPFTSFCPASVWMEFCPSLRSWSSLSKRCSPAVLYRFPTRLGAERQYQTTPFRRNLQCSSSFMGRELGRGGVANVNMKKGGKQRPNSPVRDHKAPV